MPTKMYFRNSANDSVWRFADAGTRSACTKRRFGQQRFLSNVVRMSVLTINDVPMQCQWLGNRPS